MGSEVSRGFDRRPFVYIAGIRRSGTTVLSEALTSLPYSFIFPEPRLARGHLALHRGVAEMLKREGIDVAAFARRHASRPWHVLYRKLGHRGYLLKRFQTHLYPDLTSVVQQVGVKEIDHTGWQHYMRAIPDMKVLLTGRDPRDIYISLHNRWTSGRGGWKGPFRPDLVSSELMRQFRYQLEIRDSLPTLLVKYEALCTDSNLMREVREFVNSPIPSLGHVGAFNAVNDERRDEAELHGGRVTNKRVRRWSREGDPMLLENATKCAALMHEYCQFWGYEL